MSGNDDLFQFPSDFPIKVMGRDSESFRTLTLAIVERHAGPLAADRISERASSRVPATNASRNRKSSAAMPRGSRNVCSGGKA